MSAPDKPNNVLLFGALAGSVVTLIAMVLGCIQLFTGMVAEEQDRKVASMVPPLLAALRKEESAKLSNYQWADQKAGVVRIPVQRALELTLKDWAARSTAPAPTEVKVAVPVAVKTEGLSAADKDKALADQAAAVIKAGEQLFTVKACVACHSTLDASVKSGPTLKGVLGRVETVVDPVSKAESQLTVDEAYIRESIMNSQAKLVKGFLPVMPAFTGQINNAELDALVAFVKSLK